MGGSGKKKSAKPGPTKWSDAFARTANLPCVFTVHWSHYGEVRDLVKGLDLPEHHQGGVFSTWYWATAILDGYVLENSTEGFPSGRLPSGIRVVGTRPLRLLCHLLELSQPRIRPDETAIPSKDDLLRELERQQRDQSESLESELEELLFADTTADLTVLAFELFGEPALPKEMNYDAARRIPAPGDWGRAGISMSDYREFFDVGVDIEEAKQWLQLAKSWNLHKILTSGISLSEAIAWHEDGIDVNAMPRLKEVGATAAEVKEWIALGGHAGNYPGARVLGISSTQVRPYMELGYPDLQAISFVEHNIPLETVRELDEELQPKPWERQVVRDFAISGVDRSVARRWVNLGLSMDWIQTALRKRVPLEQLEELVTAGKPTKQLERFIAAEDN
jgi:hypothetical protein